MKDFFSKLNFKHIYISTMFSVVGIFAFNSILDYFGYLGVLAIILPGMAFYFYYEYKENTSAENKMSNINVIIGLVIAFLIISFVGQKPIYIDREKATEVSKLFNNYIEEVNSYVEHNEKLIEDLEQYGYFQGTYWEGYSNNVRDTLVQEFDFYTTDDFHFLSSMYEGNLNEIIQPYIGD